MRGNGLHDMLIAAACAFAAVALGVALAILTGGGL